ncbi:hypothetical protein L596_012886 [Steinernema carpocapsae]|uniref:G-protein coupled receptors family 1 profile domain-containing protein n=1 Tax=Steinernema carpocapsae TaxID=34508 RepID=A0A4U5NZ18_STECR|nr:hypothetical protein L596_012886 [Steinernema carpocapsae]
MRPFCNNFGILNLTPEIDIAIPGYNPADRAFYTGIVYLIIGLITLPVNIFVFANFIRPPLINESCYKLIAITSFLDIVNLITACFVSGFSSILYLSYCSPGGAWLYTYGVYFMFHWYAYCAASEVLALDRLLVFARPSFAKFLFDGRRAWFWLLYVLGYATLGTVVKPSMFYIYSPVAGVFFDGDNNPFHIYNNFIKLIFITLCYVFVVIFIHKLSSGSSLKSQRTLSVQTLFVALLSAICTMGYLAVSYLPTGNPLENYAGLIGQLGWIIMHAFSGFVYLTGNRAVRDKFLGIFRKTTKNVLVVSVVPVSCRIIK